MGLPKKIAYRLRTLREAARLSQQEVAERSDLSLSLVAKMEQGRKADPRASTLIALSGALGVRPGQLIEDLVPPPEGMFAGKGKKGRKKKKLLAALVEGALTDGSPSVASGENGESELTAVAHTLGLSSEADGKQTQKKKKRK